MKTICHSSISGKTIVRSAMFGLLALGLSLGAAGGRAFGQEKFLFGIHGQGGRARGEFRDHLNTGFGGLNLEFQYAPFRKAPFTIGVSFGFLIYGVEHYEDYFGSRYADFYVDMTTTNSLINGYLSARYLIGRGAVRPYIEGLAGIGVIKTQTSADDYDDFGNQIDIENLNDSFWSCGMGGGVMIRVLQVRRQTGRNVMEGMIDIRLRYLKGGRAEYLLEGGIRREDDLLIYDVHESRTDLWTIQVGFLFKI